MSASPGSGHSISFLLRWLFFLTVLVRMPSAGIAESPDDAMWYAAVRGDRARIAESHAHGASLSRTNSDGFTPLLVAANWNHKDAVLDLLAAGANASCRTRTGWSALAFSTYWGDLRMTQAILAKGANVNDQFDDGRSIVGNAIIGGNPEVLSLLLARRARIPANGLQAAVVRGHEEIVDMLLARRANPNIGGERGYPPLVAACEHRQWSIARKLIKAGADVNGFGYCSPDCTLGHTALSHSAFHNNVEMAKVLLAARADVHAHGDLAIREAELDGSVEVYQLLRAAGATYPAPKEAHPALELIRSGKFPAPSSQGKPPPFLGLGTANGPVTAPARSGSSGDVRIAILADDRVAGDALTAAVSQQSGFALLERSEIERILAEHKLTESGLVQGTGSASLGTLLAADAIVTIHRGNANGSELYQTRMISVGTGIVLNSVFHPAPLRDVQGWASNITQRISAFRGKFSRNPNSAIALAFLNMNATLGTAKGRELEEEFKLLLTHRLVNEPSLFVLDRTEMDRLVQEKNLATGNPNPFWGGAYLVDGKIDLPLSVSNAVSIHLRFQPAAGSTCVPVEFALEGDPNHLPELVESVVSKINEGIVKRENNSKTAWNSQDEASRFLQEAKWAKACKIPTLASTAAESSWALGLHTPEVAKLRLWSRVTSIAEQRTRTEENIRKSMPGIYCDFYLGDPLNHPFRGVDCPTPAEMIDAGIRLLEVADEAFHIDPSPNPKDFMEVLASGVRIIRLIVRASDKVENAQSLTLLRQLLRQLTGQGITRWPDDTKMLICNVQMAHYICETDAEFFGCLEKTFQHRFPTDDLLNRANLRKGIADRDLNNYLQIPPFTEPRWRDAWKVECERLCKSPLPEDQFIGSLMQYRFDPNARVRREASNRFVDRFKALLPTIATDTRATGPYLGILCRLNYEFEISPFFYSANTHQEGLVALTHTVLWDDLMRDSFVYLCEKSSHLDHGVFELARNMQNVVYVNDPTSNIRNAAENLSKMNEALAAHIARMSKAPGCDPAYLATLNARKFNIPAELLGQSKPSNPASSPTVSSSPGTKPGSLLIERNCNPSKTTGLEERLEPFLASGEDALWAEGRLWYWGEVGASGESERRGFVFATDLKTLKTEAIPMPPFISKFGCYAKLAITPSRLFVCRPKEFLGVYHRDTKQWKLYPDIKSRSDSALLASGDRVYLVFETEDTNVGIVTVCDDKIDILASTRRNPPASPVDLPGGFIDLLGFNERGEIDVRASARVEGNRRYTKVFAAYCPEKKTWREMEKPEVSNLPLPPEARIYLKSGPEGEIAFLTCQANGYSGTTQIQFKNQPKFRKPNVVGTPDGIAFLEPGCDFRLWFAPAEEAKQAFTSGTAVSQPGH